MLVACSLEQYARHTQTVNLYAPLTLRFGQAHGGWTVSPGPVRRAARRKCLLYAQVSLGRGRHHRRSAVRAHGLSRRAQRTVSTRIPRAQSEVGVVDLVAGAAWGLCQAPDTRMWLNAHKVDDGTSSVSPQSLFITRYLFRRSTFQGLQSGTLRYQAVLGRSSYPPPTYNPASLGRA